MTPKTPRTRPPRYFCALALALRPDCAGQRNHAVADLSIDRDRNEAVETQQTQDVTAHIAV
jgi:hypothetical protein